jgi:hypothetical protein
MSRDAKSRVEVALTSLVSEFLPLAPDEEQLSEEKQSQALEAAKSVLDEYGILDL